MAGNGEKQVPFKMSYLAKNPEDLVPTVPEIGEDEPAEEEAISFTNEYILDTPAQSPIAEIANETASAEIVIQAAAEIVNQGAAEIVNQAAAEIVNQAAAAEIVNQAAAEIVNQAAAEIVNQAAAAEIVNQAAAEIVNQGAAAELDIDIAAEIVNRLRDNPPAPPDGSGLTYLNIPPSGVPGDRVDQILRRMTYVEASQVVNNMTLEQKDIVYSSYYKPYSPPQVPIEEIADKDEDLKFMPEEFVARIKGKKTNLGARQVNEAMPTDLERMTSNSSNTPEASQINPVVSFRNLKNSTNSTSDCYVGKNPHSTSTSKTNEKSG